MTNRHQRVSRGRQSTKRRPVWAALLKADEVDSSALASGLEASPRGKGACCGEGACRNAAPPRWVAKRPQNRLPRLFRQTALAGLRLLRSRTGTSPLATGNALIKGSIPTTVFGWQKLWSAIEITQSDIQAPEAVQQGAAWQPEFTGREGLVAVVFAQAIEQQTAFDLLQSFT